MVYLFLEWIDFNNKNSFLGFMYLKFFNVDISKRQNTKNLGMKNENDWKFAHDDDAHHYGAISLHLVCAREISRATENTDHHVRFKNGGEKKRKEKLSVQLVSRHHPLGQVRRPFQETKYDIILPQKIKYIFIFYTLRHSIFKCAVTRSRAFARFITTAVFFK